MKTAADLGIEQWELDALIKVREFLANGDVADGYDTTAPRSFDMCTGGARYECGTSCCIGGWMSAFKQDPTLTNFSATDADAYVGGVWGPNPLYNLFYGYDESVSIDFDDIKKRHAVKAIDNFLATGKPKWGEVLA